MVASSSAPTSPTAGSSSSIGADSAAQANAPTKDETATLPPKDDDVNGAPSDKYQSTATLLMMSAWNTKPRAARSWPDRPAIRGRSRARADHPNRAINVRTI